MTKLGSLSLRVRQSILPPSLLLILSPVKDAGRSISSTPARWLHVMEIECSLRSPVLTTHPTPAHHKRTDSQVAMADDEFEPATHRTAVSPKRASEEALPWGGREACSVLLALTRGPLAPCGKAKMASVRVCRPLRNPQRTPESRSQVLQQMPRARRNGEIHPTGRGRWGALWPRNPYKLCRLPL